MIHTESWYREAVFEKELGQAWAVFQRTEGTGPDAREAMLTILRLTNRGGTREAWEQAMEGMLELARGDLDTSLHEVSPDLYVLEGKNPRYRTPGLEVGTSYKRPLPGGSRFRPMFYVHAQPQRNSQGEVEDLYYYIDYANEDVRAEDPLPEDILPLDEMVSRITGYLRQELES